MTLKEKFEVVEYDHINFLEGLVEVADEFAIDFTKWLVKNELFHALLYGRIETEQLLEMYKKEAKV